MSLGSCVAKHSATHTMESKTAYANCPPRTLFCKEKAKSDAVAAGPTAHWIATTVCARPLVAPGDRLFGGEEEIYMSIEPNKIGREQKWSSASVERQKYGETH